jgi:hypothetical protein
MASNFRSSTLDWFDRGLATLEREARVAWAATVETFQDAKDLIAEHRAEQDGCCAHGRAGDESPAEDSH